MDTDLAPPLTLDLTGLPAPVVRHIVEIAEAAPAGVSPTDLPPGDISLPKLTPEQFCQARERMASMSSGQSLPLDFSTADIYGDHG